MNTKHQFVVATGKTDQEYRKLFDQAGFLTAVLIEIMDELQGSKLYKQDIKKSGNLFLKDLEKVLDFHFNVYENDTTMKDKHNMDAQDYYNNTSILMSKMAQLYRERKPFEICSMVSLIEQSEESGLDLKEVLLHYTPLQK